jgi:RHS repeat-associated protein
MGRLRQSINPKGKIEKFLHDPAGDLLRSTHQFDEDTGRRKSSYNDTDYFFDEAGNLVERHTDKGCATFEWDGNDRLCKAENERGQKVEMVYDAQGRRMAKVVDGAAVRFTWDGDQLLSDDKGYGGHREFIYYPGTFEPLAHINADGGIYYYQNDNVGLPHEVCNEIGQVVWSATYTPHGAVDEQYEHQIDNPLRFQGQYHDEEIGLNYNRFRFYDPNVGAFVSQDPLGLIAGDNVYRYAPNVWRWIDPLGLSCDVGGEGEIVRRFMSKQDVKKAKKKGIPFDPKAKKPGIDAATTDIEPVNPDAIKDMLGARNADAYVDIDISGKKVLRRKTKAGHNEIVILEDVKPEDIVGKGTVKKSAMSAD